MYKKNVFFMIGAVVAVIFLLSSCVSYNFKENISPSGMSHTSMSIDLSKVKAMFESLPSSGELSMNISGNNSSVNVNPSVNNSSKQFGKKVAAICKNFTNNNSIALTNKKCKFDNSSSVITFSGDVQIPQSAFNSSKNATGTIYYYDVKDVIKRIAIYFLSSSQTNQIPTNDSAGQSQLKEEEKAIPINFTVSMPGKIVSSEFGSMNGNVISGSYYDLLLHKGSAIAKSFVQTKSQSKEKANVFSTETMIFISLGVAIVIVLILILAFRRKGKK